MQRQGQTETETDRKRQTESMSPTENDKLIPTRFRGSSMQFPLTLATSFCCFIINVIIIIFIIRKIAFLFIYFFPLEILYLT